MDLLLFIVNYVVCFKMSISIFHIIYLTSCTVEAWEEEDTAADPPKKNITLGKTYFLRHLSVKCIQNTSVSDDSCFTLAGR